MHIEQNMFKPNRGLFLPCRRCYNHSLNVLFQDMILPFPFWPIIDAYSCFIPASLCINVKVFQQQTSLSLHRSHSVLVAVTACLLMWSRLQPVCCGSPWTGPLTGSDSLQRSLCRHVSQLQVWQQHAALADHERRWRPRDPNTVRWESHLNRTLLQGRLCCSNINYKNAY